MSDETAPVELLFSDEFKARLRSLAKRYRKIQSDLQPLLEDLQAGNFDGDRMSGTGENPVFKIRLKNSDIRKGKSAGYRVIYEVRDSVCVLLIVIYAKSDERSIAPEKIRAIVAEFDA
jgi:mRNA-degrading endonuclease RelE of RelBE toxin-antitoxin system